MEYGCFDLHCANYFNIRVATKIFTRLQEIPVGICVAYREIIKYIWFDSVIWVHIFNNAAPRSKGCGINYLIQI